LFCIAFLLYIKIFSLSHVVKYSRCAIISHGGPAEVSAIVRRRLSTASGQSW
jgi:hypothetical protein